MFVFVVSFAGKPVDSKKKRSKGIVLQQKCKMVFWDAESPAILKGSLWFRIIFLNSFKGNVLIFKFSLKIIEYILLLNESILLFIG